jgi:pantoate--beta-alanine ligase
MKVAQTLAAFEDQRRDLLTAAPGARVGLVPTMGALHAGHLSLIKLARERSDLVAVSIFVNPLQFGPAEDYSVYPRRLPDDLDACQANGVDLVLVPPVSEIYPADRQVVVSAGSMGTVFEGAARPGHFDGVLTVVLKLLNIVRPDFAVFGQKDAQQLACVRRMVTDLNVGVEIVGGPIVREPDGLALSSRNQFLTEADRQAGLALSAALRAAATETLPGSALAAAEKILAAAGPELAVDYLALVNQATMTDVGPDHRGPATMIVAAKVGSVRLIDNAELTFAG